MWEEATNYFSHGRGEGKSISLYERPNGLYHYSATQLHERPDGDSVNKDTVRFALYASAWIFFFFGGGVKSAIQMLICEFLYQIYEEHT